MRKIFLAYRVMATIVGVLLAVLFLIAVPLGNFDGSPMWCPEPDTCAFTSTPMWFEPGSGPQQFGEQLGQSLGVAHGWLYMIFLFAAFMLSRRAKWDMPFTILTLVLGTVPLLSFWAEHRATKRVRAEFPDLA